MIAAEYAFALSVSLVAKLELKKKIKILPKRRDRSRLVCSVKFFVFTSGKHPSANRCVAERLLRDLNDISGRPLTEALRQWSFSTALVWKSSQSPPPAP